ncbi:MAG: hypothetical protein H6662_08995 [Ardenticatenaceae bacterium]|nr:hypothetical protein [Anaerolineales bacterium]MCB8921706.1 hypothetical protein [Ardenticatenaceae bacterium]MCB8990775.1 hypothetical protein [Ardenticatenaceae bacterium]MCB9003262.1 hypothetical protein [Ardenticatenaceae bacterium]
MKKSFAVTVVLILLLGLFAGVIQAQEPGQPRGTIMGVIYEDVDGDGRCVDTGVAGEVPVANIDVEFVSSDEKTVLTMYSSADGAFGLYAAGFSYWKLTAKPTADWVVTSENPIYAPVDAQSPAINGLFFCVQKASQARVYLPTSGDPVGAGVLMATAVSGLGLVFAGITLEIRRRK